MTEKLLQFIWRYQYYQATDLQTRQGEPVEVLDPGIWNQDQGPDFLQARIRIGGTVWAGAVEIHLHSSGWDAHQHQHDPAYQQVVLHVVWTHDRDAAIPCPELELAGRISRSMLDQYAQWMTNHSALPCQAGLAQVPEIIWINWQDRLLVERLEQRAARLLSAAQAIGYHWQQFAWHELARNYGGRLNGNLFEQMARSLEVDWLFRERHHPVRLEALLFGQVGLLEEAFDESYPSLLQREYRLLQRKYGLKPVPGHVNRLRMRPRDFPDIRLAQLAAVLQQGPEVISTLLTSGNDRLFARLFRQPANDYWHYHFRFGSETAYQPKIAGETFVERLQLNLLLPLQLAYQLWLGEARGTSAFVEAYGECPPETISKLRVFDGHPSKPRHAGDTQARLQLLDHYCGPKRCLNCAVGTWLLKPTDTPP